MSVSQRQEIVTRMSDWSSSSRPESGPVLCEPPSPTVPDRLLRIPAAQSPDMRGAKPFNVTLVQR